MMEKLAQAGEGGGGCTPTPFTIFTITFNVAVYAPAETVDILPLFNFYPYLLGELKHRLKMATFLRTIGQDGIFGPTW